MVELKISVRDGNEPPQDSECQPAEDETQREDEHRPAPLDVHHGGEDVGQVTSTSLGHVALHHVALAILEDDALADTSRTPPTRTIPAFISNELVFSALADNPSPLFHSKNDR